MLIVQKYGGTSVGTPERLRAVAGRIATHRRRGDQVVAVVSAMGHTTDQLQDLARQVTERPSRRELDMLLTAGERISMALLSMALDTLDIPAISFTGSQSGIITDTAHTRARIVDVRPIRIGPELEKGKVVIVAGFQGVSAEKEVTTLGRGGSDTTAVALAAGLAADRLEICTDVPGVLTADPARVPAARLLRHLDWDTLLELASAGAGVVHSRAVELARIRRLPFHVCSTFEEEAGTLVDGTPFENGPAAAGITGRPRVAEIHFKGLRLATDAARFFADLDLLLEDVTGLHQEESGSATHITFHVPLDPEDDDLRNSLRCLAESHQGTVEIEATHAAVSVVGSRTLDVPEVASRAYRALADAGIRPASMHTGNLSLTLLIPEDAYVEAQVALHKEFIEEN